MGREGTCTGFWWGNLRERDHWGDRHRWEDDIKMDVQEVGVLTGLNWLRMETGWTFMNAVMNLRVP
jgi:hypothetical protein